MENLKLLATNEIEDMLEELQKELFERKQQAIKDYENNPITHQGWAQQDLIDMYRMER